MGTEADHLNSLYIEDELFIRQPDAIRLPWKRRTARKRYSCRCGVRIERGRAYYDANAPQTKHVRACSTRCARNEDARFAALLSEGGA